MKTGMLAVVAAVIVGILAYLVWPQLANAPVGEDGAGDQKSDGTNAIPNH